MSNFTFPGVDWLQPVGTDCSVCNGSQMRQLTLSKKILVLNDSFNTYNEQQPDDDGYFGVHKALYFAKTTEGIKAELTTYLANLEKRVFEELLSPDIFQTIKDAQWLEGKRLENDLLSKTNTPLITYGIAEEVDGHPTKTKADLYQWIVRNIEEIKTLMKSVKKLTYKLPPESFAEVYEKHSKKIDMESLQDFYDEKILSVGKLTFRKLQAFRTRVVADFINLGVLRFAYTPTQEEIAEVDIERVKRELPPDYEFKPYFIEHCAIFRKMIRWQGVYLDIDKENYGKYFCLFMSKLTPDELMEFFKIEKLLALIHEAIKNLPAEEGKKGLKEKGTTIVSTAHSDSRKRIFKELCDLADKGDWARGITSGDVKTMLINVLCFGEPLEGKEAEMSEQLWQLLEKGRGDRVKIVWQNMVGYLDDRKTLKLKGAPALNKDFFGTEESYSNIDKGRPSRENCSSGFREVIPLLDSYVPKV